MVVPTIHLNGTSREALLDQACKASLAARALADALADMSPNARDYYPQGVNVIAVAFHEHDERIVKVLEIMDELIALAAAIAYA